MSRRAIVLDASAAVRIVSLETRWAQMDRYDFHAPSLMWSEALSGLSQATYRREMPASALWTALERLETWPVTRHEPDAERRAATLRIALGLGWAKTYDAEYVALAISLAIPILSTDERLRRRAGRIVTFVGPLDLD